MAAINHMLFSEMASSGTQKGSDSPTLFPNDDQLDLPVLSYTSAIQKPVAALTAAVPAPGASEDVTYPPQRLGHDHPVTDHQAKLFKRRSHIHFAALCWFMFLEGWNDGTPGPLLPTIQEVYHVKQSLAGLFLNDSMKHVN